MDIRVSQQTETKQRPSMSMTSQNVDEPKSATQSTEFGLSAMHEALEEN